MIYECGSERIQWEKSLTQTSRPDCGGINCHKLEPEQYDDDDDTCGHCGGSGEEESNDPLWDGFDSRGNPNYVECWNCRGTGKRKP